MCAGGACQGLPMCCTSSGELHGRRGGPERCVRVALAWHAWWGGDGSSNNAVARGAASVTSTSVPGFAPPARQEPAEDHEPCHRPKTVRTVFNVKSVVKYVPTTW